MQMRPDPAKGVVVFRGKADQFAITDSEFTVPFSLILAASVVVEATLLMQLYQIPTQIDCHASGAPSPGSDADSVHVPGTPALRLQ